MFETNFSGYNKIWGAQKIAGIAHECPPWLWACTYSK